MYVIINYFYGKSSHTRPGHTDLPNCPTLSERDHHTEKWPCPNRDLYMDL